MQHAGDPSLLEISIDDKTYTGANARPVQALRDLQLSVAKNAFDVIIGPSGCGKTTLLRILAGLDADFKGTIHAPTDQQLGFVFQEPRLLPWRTVRENICLTAAPGLDEAELEDLVGEMGLADVLDRFPRELSLGLARRVALARAFASRPDLLLLDEPFVSLDQPTAERLRRMLVRVWSSRPTTAVMVTHNLREALQLGDRLIMLCARPARVRGVYSVSQPREARSEDDIEAMRREIMAEYPDLV